MTQLSVIVPTFREAENLDVLIPRLQQVFTDASINGEVIVVDDNSPDDTVNVVQRLSQAYPVRLIVRRNERGLSSAVIAGMRVAVGDVVLCMDADLSHPPEDVPRLYRQVSANPLGRLSDFVIGSRYVTGGSTESGWGLGRWLNSKVATWLAWPLASVSDPMAGFFALSREAFLRAAEHLDPIGYKIGLELLVKTKARTVTEVPIEFKNRLHGESKLSLREQLNYLRHLARLYRFRFPRLTRFLSFGLVGSSGAAVDLLTFVLLLKFGLSPLPAAILAIWVAMTSNFEFNRRLTFADGDRSWSQAYLSFCLSCLFGAGVNTGVRVGLMSSLSWFSGHAWGAAVLGILSGLAFNFSLCERFVFRVSRGTRFPQASSSVEDGQVEIVSREGSILTQCEVTPGQGIKRVKPRDSWLFRCLLLVVVVVSVLWAKSLSSQSQKPTPKSAEKPISDRQIADPALPVPSNADQRMAENSAKSSSGLTLSKYRDFGFSDVDVEQRLKGNVRYLASDELEGRGPQTAGLDKAAEFIAHEYQKAGLNTNPTGKGVFFEFPLLAREVEPTVSQVALLDSNRRVHPLTPKRDFSSVVLTKSKQLSGGLVFAGFGISAPEHGYDDFAGLDVLGQILIVLRQEPTHETWQKLAVERGFTPHALLRTKIRNAMSHGAAAVVLCDALATDPQDSSDHPQELFSHNLTSEFPDTKMPVIHARREALETLLTKTAEFDLGAAEAEIHKTLTPQSQRLMNVSMSIRVERPQMSRSLKNVIATVSSDSLRLDETIVVGAHYDHLGRGGWGSLEPTHRHDIHNGADDNASGTSVLLEVARQLATREALNPKMPLPRRVCFIAFSGEELGLIGSNKYVHAPWFPMERTVAMLNLDMVGRLRNDQLTVYGTGTSSVWPPLLRRLADHHSLNVISREGGYGPSDHASFHERGVPVLHFFTGFHSDYHRPSDDPDTLNYVGLRKLSRAVAEMVVALAEMPERPRSSTSQKDLAEFDPSISLRDVVGSIQPPARFQLGVQLAPSTSGGVLLERTIPQSLADRHGLRSGDVIQKINGQPVDSPAAAITKIQKHPLHDPLIISLIRNGLRMKINVSILD